MKKILLLVGLVLFPFSGHCQYPTNFVFGSVTIPGPQQTFIDGVGITMSYDVLGDTGSAKFYLADQGDGTDAFSFEGAGLNASKLYTSLIEMFVGGKYTLLVGSGSGLTVRFEEANIFSVGADGTTVTGDAQVSGAVKSGSYNGLYATENYLRLGETNGTGYSGKMVLTTGTNNSIQLVGLTGSITCGVANADKIITTNLTIDGTFNITTLNVTNITVSGDTPLSGTKTFYASNSVLNTVVVSNGLIMSWTP